MSAYRLSRFAIVCAMAAFGLSSCSNPESEAPVEVTPGMYAIKVGSFGKAKDQLCFSAGDADNVDRLIKKYYAFLEEGCSHKTEPRVGNKVSGAISCEIDPTAGWKTTYTGTLAADSITVNAEIVNYANDTSGKREEVTTQGQLTAQRVGDCS